ncbi:MAG: hypothetical protein SVR04_03500 [Spirochaetota bacterium]|nr:hypothetical protein [Spirochaetota bacterium]
MKKRPNVISIDQQIEAAYLESVLKDRDIPYVLVSYYDTAYAGLFQSQDGWGHVEVPMEHADEVRTLYTEVKKAGPAGREDAPEQADLQ